MSPQEQLSALLNPETGKRIAGFATACIDTPYRSGMSVPMYEARGRHPSEFETGLDHIGHVIAVYKAYCGVELPRPNEGVYMKDWLSTFCETVPLHEATIGDVYAFSDPQNVNYVQLGFRVSKATVCLVHGGRPCVEAWFAPYWEKNALKAFRFQGVK